MGTIIIFWFAMTIAYSSGPFVSAHQAVHVVSFGCSLMEENCCLDSSGPWSPQDGPQDRRACSIRSGGNDREIEILREVQVV